MVGVVVVVVVVVGLVVVVVLVVGLVFVVVVLVVRRCEEDIAVFERWFSDASRTHGREKGRPTGSSSA